LWLNLDPVNQACFFLNLGEDNLQVMWRPANSTIATCVI